MPSAPTASVVVPTRARPEYLDVALASVVPQALAASAEVLVVTDGPDPASAEIAARHGARSISLPNRFGPNAGRNAGVAAAAGELIVFIDDDVWAPPGWIDAILAGVLAAPDRDVFGGPIRARFEGGGPHACGRDRAPITTLDLGGQDRDVQYVWSANMAVRARAFARVGGFEEALVGRGEEEEWERRYAATGGRIRYLARAGLDHRRSAADSTIRKLSRAAYALGRTARRNDVRKGTSPSSLRELRTLVGCAWHAIRRRCAFGIVFGAEAAGRLREALADLGLGTPLAPAPAADRYDKPPEDFLSGTSGQVTGIRRTTGAIVADALDDAVVIAGAQRRRLRDAARGLSRRRVLAFAIDAGGPNLLAGARAELMRSRHDVRFASVTAGSRGKFENLNALLDAHPVGGYDWLIVVDDDVALPVDFLDCFLFLAERFDLRLAQPAHRQRSHAAWEITRRRRGSVVRETSFVEIGPVFAFAAETFSVLLPFPPLRVGWGLELHWSALAREHGWRSGIVDATPITHGLRPVATSYSRHAAVSEAREFLSTHPYTPAAVAQQTLVTHRSWSR